MQDNTNAQGITLASTKTAFDKWRLSKTSRSEAIPQYLWEMVKLLPCHNDASKMRTVLGITRDQLNKYVFNSSDNNIPKLAPHDFMQVQHSPVLHESPECHLTIQHRDGHQMTIASTKTFAADAIRAFISGAL